MALPVASSSPVLLELGGQDVAPGGTSTSELIGCATLAEPVVDVVQPAVLDEQRVPAGDPAVGEEHALRLARCSTAAAIVYERRRMFTATDSGTSAVSG